jgi:long-chain acyl-CoA synthetase
VLLKNIPEIAVSTGSACEAELIDFCKQHLPTYKRPKSIRLMDALPRSAVGKILRRELRKID